MTSREKYKFLYNVKKVLDEAGIEFWLESGTLLGAIRDGDFIEWDKDIDISIMRKDRIKIQRIASKFYTIGTFGEHRRGNFISSHYIIKDDFKMDIYYWFKAKEEYVSYTNGEYSTVVNNNYLDDLKEITFKGLKVKVPNNPKQYLEDRYGKGWKLPDKNWQENKQLTLKPLKDYLKYFV